ncbi:MAG: LysM peptidoglycan-binding domain-containing protein [Myxococcales bacterium]|nr:LysM peptidoglycan-binding domain-containing protein [Myxococcales bacterium]
MIRSLAVMVYALALSSALAAGASELLPRPDALEPNVRFWTRVYSEVDGQSGLIHDAVHLDVVYETLRLPKGLSARGQERHVEQVKKRYRAILRELATGKRSGLTPEEERVLGRWPEGTTNATFRSASRNLRFQLGQADKFREGLVRSGVWRDYIDEVLRERGIPEQLVALPHVESSYNPHAYSRVGAAGLWQFTRSTGRRYLRIDHVVDERLDPERATVAAARLLEDNYRALQSWPLAITAYNHGSSGMRRAVRKLGTGDIGAIVQRYQSRTFGFASRNFYASFLAALDVDHHADLYFGPVALDEPVEYDTVVIDDYYPVSSIGRALGIDRETLRQHNLSLRPAVWNGSKYLPRGYELRVPSDRLTEAPEVALRTIPSDERFARQHRDRYYKVRRGDTLSKIAGRYGVRERQLVALNNLRSRHRIHAGQVLVLPDAAGSDILAVEREELPADGIYRVRRGDTIGIIARRFGTSEAQLVADNDLRNRHRIAVGQRLRLPGATPSVVAAADVDIQSEPAAAESPMPPPAEPDPTGDAPAEAIVAAAVTEADGDPFDADPAADPEIFVPLPDAAADPAPVADGSDNGEEPVYASVAAAVATAADDPPSPDPSNYSVTPKHRITVQAEETLGHYAEWLEVSTSRLRQLNRMSQGTPLAIGQQVHLDVSRVSPETFEERRLEYHQTLQAEFFASFVVADTETHVLRNGDTIWILAREKFEVPVWLLRQYNPDLDFRSLKAGTSMIIPIIEPRES